MTSQSAAAATEPSYPRFLDAGETALVVEFGDTVDPAINARGWHSMRPPEPPF